jgi:hypothetical protein
MMEPHTSDMQNASLVQNGSMTHAACALQGALPTVNSMAHRSEATRCRASADMMWLALYGTCNTLIQTKCS